jgi:recombination protein RecA
MTQDNEITTKIAPSKEKLLELAIKELEKANKTTSLVTKGGKGRYLRWPSVPTGSLALDVALGIGGYPKGRITEIIGGESTGKTTLALLAVANVQREGGKALYIDGEHALDLNYAANLGVDVAELYLCQPDNGSVGTDTLNRILKTGAIDIAIYDSVPSILPATIADGNVSDQEMAGSARLISKCLAMITPHIRKHNVTMIFLNQIRMKIGVIFGNPETAPGGGALNFYTSVIIWLTRQLKEEIKNEEDERIGNQVTANVRKNKMAPPFKKAIYDIRYGSGIDRSGEILDLAETHGLITRAGAWYSHGTERVGQGRNNAREFLITHPDLMSDLETQLRNRVFNSIEYANPVEDDSPDPPPNNKAVDDKQLSFA